MREMRHGVSEAHRLPHGVVGGHVDVGAGERVIRLLGSDSGILAMSCD